MSRNQSIATALILAVVLGASMRAPARAMLGAAPVGGGMGFEPEPGMQLAMIVRSVGLSAEQEKGVQAAMDAHRARFRELFRDLRTANGELSAKMLAPGPLHEEDLTPAVRRVAALREALMQEGVRVALEVRGVLTPAQLAKAADVRQRLQALQDEIKQLLGEPAGLPAPPLP